jgi:hypothetical protein
MWTKRCLVIGPVLAFVMTALLLSCGSSSTTSPPAATTTPVTLIAIRICGQKPSSQACTPSGLVQIPLGGQNYELWAQGQFSSNGVNSFTDISPSATWFVDNDLLFSAGSGLFDAGQTKGCTCITAASGNIISAPVLAGVGKSPTVCTPCPPSPPS